MAEVRDEESERAKELRELKKLRDDGVIDEDEWKEKKREVLGQPWVPAKREPLPAAASPADAAATPPKKKAKPPPAPTPKPAKPEEPEERIDLTGDEAPPPPPPPPPPQPAAQPAAQLAAQPPPKTISDDDIKKNYLKNGQKALKARKAWASWDGTGTAPGKITGSFQPFEDVKFGELLNKYGQPKKNSSEMNDPAVKAFEAEFNYRVWASVVPHVNVFNHKEYKEWRIKKGGKAPDGVGGPWVGDDFVWKQLVESKAS